MKKIDEMNRNIQLRAQEWGYRAALSALGVWTLFNCYQTLGTGAAYHPLPGLILCFSVGIQSFYQLALERQMVAGDADYQAPNKFLHTLAASLIIAAIILSIGTYFILSA